MHIEHYNLSSNCGWRRGVVSPTGGFWDGWRAKSSPPRSMIKMDEWLEGKEQYRHQQQGTKQIRAVTMDVDDGSNNG